MKARLRQTVERHFPRVLEALRSATKAPTFRYRYHRRPGSLDAEGGYTTGEGANDEHLIDRLVQSYLLRKELPSGQWSDIFLDRHADINEAFANMDRQRIEEILRNPASSDIFFGFDGTVKSLRTGGQRIEDRRAPGVTLDALTSLAEALGARKMELPESYYFWRVNRIRADEVLDQIDKAIGFKVQVPNPFPSEYGLVCARGIVSFRAAQAMYQAWRIARLLEGIEKPKVLEIGGGLGRTAFYARQFGIQDYTIVDIPVSSLAQGYFIGRTLGEESVSLFGENVTEDRVKIMPPGFFLDGTERYDLVVNVDSLTEIGRAAADQYWLAIERRASRLLSINHEANEFTVAQLIREAKHARASRMPYWMRRGFVEEVVEFAPRNT
jgi:hypothetical protein